MKCEIFYASNREILRDVINKWLERHPVSPDSMKFEFTTVCVDDAYEYKLEFTLILFYVPMVQM